MRRSLGLAALVLVAVVGEAVAITAVAVVAGTAASVVMMAAMVQASQLATGLTIPFRLAPIGVLTSGATLLLAVGAVSLLPAWRISRIDVVDALQYE